MTQTRKQSCGSPQEKCVSGLLLYYNDRGRNSGIRISLPVGSYIPEFLHGHEGSDDLGDHARFPGSSPPRCQTSLADTATAAALELRPMSLVAGSWCQALDFPFGLPEEVQPIQPGARTRRSLRAFGGWVWAECW